MSNLTDRLRATGINNSLPWELSRIAADELDRLTAERDALQGQITAHQIALNSVRAENAALKEQKDGVYLERNQLVAALSKVFPSGKKRTAIKGWSADWHGCVYIDLPTGQASWHYHDSHAYLFEHLPEYVGSWDGHTTPEKYERVSALNPQREEKPE